MRDMRRSEPYKMYISGDHFSDEECQELKLYKKTEDQYTRFLISIYHPRNNIKVCVKSYIRRPLSRFHPKHTDII